MLTAHMAIAPLLLPFLREMIKGPTPIHGVEGAAAAQREGTAFRESTGGRHRQRLRPLWTAQSGRRGTQEKNHLAALRDGNLAIVFDNVKLLVQSAELASATTKSFWTGRILGISADLRVDPLWSSG